MYVVKTNSYVTHAEYSADFRKLILEICHLLPTISMYRVIDRQVFIELHTSDRFTLPYSRCFNCKFKCIRKGIHVRTLKRFYPTQILQALFSHLITAPDTLTSKEKKTDLGSQKERGKAYPLAVNRLIRVAVAFQIFVRLPALPKKVFRNLSYFQIRIVDSKRHKRVLLGTFLRTNSGRLLL